MSIESEARTISIPGRRPLSLPPELTDPPVVVHPHGSIGTERGRMLLLHGLANSSTVWREFLRHRPVGIDIWSADMPWRNEGISAWYHDDDPSYWLESAFESVTGPVDIVVAHSFSAIQLLSYLDRQLSSGADPFGYYGIRGLVLISPFYRRNPEDFTWDAMTRYLDEFQMIMEEGIRVHSGGRIGHDVQRDMARRVCERVGPYGWMKFVDSYLRTPWLQVDRIDVPAVVVCGEHDFAASPTEGQALAAALPNAGFRMLADCGHFLMFERPAEFAAAVGEFADTLLGRAGASGARLDEECHQ